MKRLRCAGALAAAVGFGSVAMIHPGIALADPSADPGGASQVESPGSGDPGSKTGSEVVSSGGSAPPMGAGSVVAGSGSDVSSGPGQASGSTTSSFDPAPGVSIQSSGGALTSVLYGTDPGHPEATTVGDSSAGGSSTASTSSASTSSASTSTATTTSAPATTTPVAAQSVSAVEPVEPAVAVTETRVAARGVAAPSGDVVRAGIVDDVLASTSSTPARTTISLLAAANGTPSGAGDHSSTVGGAAEPVLVAARPPAATPTDDGPAPEPVATFTGILAAALAPLVVPVPGSPVDAPTLWVVLAWVRRQSEGVPVGRGRSPVAAPRQTEMVLADPAAPRAVVDGVDRTTGRVQGHVDLGGSEPDGSPTHALVGHLDPRVGAATVDPDSGQWTFTPTPAARLATHLQLGAGVVTFAVGTSDGRTVDVEAPVDPAEAVVTGTIDVGSGLTYGMAVIGDRLYVLNGSDDAAGNGSVKVVDAPTRSVVGSVEVGGMPFAMAASGRMLYVGNADDGTVSVIDSRTNAVVDVVHVGANPFGLEATADHLYVADLAGTVSVIDLADNTELVRIPVGGDPFALAATADRVYVTNYGGGTVAVLDSTTNTAEGAETAGYPYYAAVVGKRLYVVNVATNALTVVDRSTTTAVDVDPKTRALDAIPPDAAPVDMVVRGDRLYLSNIHCGTVTVVDVATNRTVENVGVGIQPGLIAASRDGRTVYVSDVMGGTVRVITSVRHAAQSTV
ncbi:hypothetical protein [Mycobacterium yunnanensis]|uniref:hypothetical protein n=1 Tax=Mycobacterium yunnanensis TaxID=368477 RepID=UPI0021F38971|nr:hypothetical protein [Mycobacterium yunnanensis]